MIADGLLAFALVLTTATQLRPGTSSVGPAEVMMVLWILVAGFRLLRHGVLRLDEPVRVVGGFWLAFVTSLCIGDMVGLLIETRRDGISAIHDIFAYALLLPVSVLAVVQDDASARLTRTAWMCVVFGNFLLVAQFANAYGMFSVSFLHPWYWDRLEGWSTNPNQLALLAAVLQFLALHLAERATSRLGRLAGIACAPLPFLAGAMSLSDTFIVVCICCFLMLGAMTLRRWIVVASSSATQVLSAWAVMLAVPVLLLSLLPFIPFAMAQADQYANSVYNGTDRSRVATSEGAVRLRLWHEAVVRGVGAAGLGLGPGAHLMNPPYKREPPPKFEAHNTVLDIFTQGGVLGVLAVVWIWGKALKVAWRGHAAGLATATCAIAVFSMFHLIIRQPMFWFTMALSLSTGLAPVAGVSSSGPRSAGV